jgi:inner membrane protein
VDNLTHSLAGAALGEAGLKKMSGLAMAALIIGANIPDVDAVVLLTGGDMLPARRGWTHGPVALAVLPLLLTGALVAFDNLQLRFNSRPLDRPIVRPWQLLVLSFVGCLTHPLMDWLNTYGVRLLMPFSERWFQGDGVQIIDPWIWLALGIGILVSRRRDRANRRDHTRPARIAVVAVTVYALAMVAGSRITRDVVMREITAAEGIQPRRVLAGPVFVNSFRRALIIDSGDRYRFGTVDWVPQRSIEIGTDGVRTNLDHPLALAARERAEIRNFLYWSRFPYFVLHGDSIAGFLEVRDARFRGERVGPNPFRRVVPLEELTGG